MKTFNQFINESKSFSGNDEITLFDKKQAKKFLEALELVKTNSTVDIDAARYTLTNFDQENDTVKVKKIGTVSYSDLVKFTKDFIENY